MLLQSMAPKKRKLGETEKRRKNAYALLDNSQNFCAAFLFPLNETNEFPLRVPFETIRRRLRDSGPSGRRGSSKADLNRSTDGGRVEINCAHGRVHI